MPQDGRAGLPRKADAPAADASADDLHADRKGIRSRLACAGAGRGGLRLQAETRYSDTAWKTTPRRSPSKIRTAAKAKVRGPNRAPAATASKSADAVLPAMRNKIASTEKILIVIGASTGGTEAIKEVLIRLPPDCPGHRHRPAHAGRIHQILRGASRQLVPDQRQGSGARRPHAARPRLHRSGPLASAAGPKWRELRVRAVAGRSGQSPPPFGRRAVPLGRQQGGQECGRHHPHRHGQGWRPRACWK